MLRRIYFFFGLLLYADPNVWAQTTISGVVTGENRDPLYGVNVTVQGTTRGTITSENGKYSIEVSKGQMLIFSYIGYRGRNVVIENQTTVNINLKAENSTLQEVVVTALGINKEKEKLGFSVTELAVDNLNKARETNIANSLTGMVAGLVVKGTSSGSSGTSKVILRGLPSISGTGSPLYVINGVPVDNTQRGASGEWGGSDSGDGIGNINPDDIEKITVLKGQAASALYGSRASNGVILITTKKGAEGKWSINYTMNMMAQVPVDYTDFQSKYGQGSDGKKPLTSTDAKTTGRLSWGSKLDGSQVLGFDGKQYSYSPAKNNYLSFYKTGVNLTNTVSIGRGYTGGSFRFSLSNLNSNSIVPNTNDKRNSFNISIVQDITKKLEVSAMMNYLDQRSENIPFLSDGPRNPNNFLFLAPNIDHTIFAPGYDSQTGHETVFSDDIYVTNPYFITHNGINNLDRKRIITSLGAKYSFTDKIYASLIFGNDIANDKNYDVEPSGLAFTTDMLGNLKFKGQSERSELNLQGFVSGTFSLASSIEMDALIGGNLRRNEFEFVGIGGNRFVLPGLYSPYNVKDFIRFEDSYKYNRRAVNSGFYSVGFGLWDILNLTTTGRFDVYSTLPVNNNSIFSPSITMALLFGNLLKMSSLDLGKLRASYAVTSGEAFDAYQDRFYYSLENSYKGVATGSSPISLPNLFLKPFTTRELEFGLELSFYKRRLAFDLAYFDKKTRDEIMNADYSITSGFNKAVVATGSVQNRGLEMLVEGVPVKRNSFSWKPSFNITFVKNKVLSTDANNRSINLGQNRATLGNAVTAFVVGEAGPQIQAYDYKRDNAGNIMYSEAGLPVRGELKNWGSVLPTVYGGFNNQFDYKGLSLAFLIDYNFGNKVLSATEFYSLFRGLHKNTLVGREEGVNANGMNVSAEKYYQVLAQNITSTSVIDGDFIKLRQVVLSYSLPSKFFDKINIISGIDISLVARNLAFLMRKAKNIDPEASFGSTIKYTGIEGTSLPSARSYGFNLNFKLN